MADFEVQIEHRRAKLQEEIIKIKSLPGSQIVNHCIDYVAFEAKEVEMNRLFCSETGIHGYTNFSDVSILLARLGGCSPRSLAVLRQALRIGRTRYKAYLNNVQSAFDSVEHTATHENILIFCSLFSETVSLYDMNCNYHIRPHLLQNLNLVDQILDGEKTIQVLNIIPLENHNCDVVDIGLVGCTAYDYFIPVKSNVNSRTIEFYEARLEDISLLCIISSEAELVYRKSDQNSTLKLASLTPAQPLRRINVDPAPRVNRGNELPLQVQPINLAQYADQFFNQAMLPMPSAYNFEQRISTVLTTSLCLDQYKVEFPDQSIRLHSELDMDTISILTDLAKFAAMPITSIDFLRNPVPYWKLKPTATFRILVDDPPKAMPVHAVCHLVLGYVTVLGLRYQLTAVSSNTVSKQQLQERIWYK